MSHKGEPLKKKEKIDERGNRKQEISNTESENAMKCPLVILNVGKCIGILSLQS